MRTLSTATTGMQAQEQKLAQIANDMANMNTTAYKRGRTDFQDLMYQQIKEAGGQPGAGQVPVGVQVGSGVKVAGQYQIHEQGPTKITGNNMDVSVNGDGFFQVQVEGGQTAFTRDGSFKLDSSGRFVTNSGYLLVPAIQLPPNSMNLSIGTNGEVRVTTSNNQEIQVGQIKLYSFLNSEGMRAAGRNLMQPTTASGPPVEGVPGENGMGLCQQGALEGSNVKPTEAVMDMITTQRAYESNARIMGVSDQMWATTNNIGNR